MTAWASLTLYRKAADLEVGTDSTSYDIGQDFKNRGQFWRYIFSISNYLDKMTILSHENEIVNLSH